MLRTSIRRALLLCCSATLVLAGVRAQAATDAFGSLAYRAIGPAISGGRVTAVAGSDADARVYYAGGAGGGVYKSTDGGASWAPVFDREPVAPIGAIAVARRNPNDVWVGTGESNPRNEVEEGAGVWHSTDGGKHWTHAGLDDAGTISAISIDPRDPQRVAVGVLGHIFRDSAARGVFVTADGGAHWKRTLFLGLATGASDLARRSRTGRRRCSRGCGASAGSRGRSAAAAPKTASTGPTTTARRGASSRVACRAASSARSVSRPAAAGASTPRSRPSTASCGAPTTAARRGARCRTARTWARGRSTSPTSSSTPRTRTGSSPSR